MEEYSRTVEQVIGHDPALLEYWDKLPDTTKKSLLCSNATVSTLGELQILSNQLQELNARPPSVS